MPEPIDRFIQHQQHERCYSRVSLGEVLRHTVHCRHPEVDVVHGIVRVGSRFGEQVMRSLTLEHHRDNNLAGAVYACT